MKTSKRKMKSIGIFALVLVMLMSAILPLSAAGSAIDEAMGTYIVKQGDTLSSIAAAHGTTVSDIVTTNGISASAELYVGQKLDIPGAMAVEDDSTTVYGSSSTISVNFKDADLVGALETVLAHTGYTMIFKGSTTKVPAISLDNVTPLTAIDYILRMVDMTYIKHDDIIYVGSAATLNSSFADKDALTKFALKYISTDTLTSQLSTLGVSVKLVKVDINLREFWITGTPMELAKVNQLIKILDNKKNTTVGSASISTSLSAIELKYISASEFSSLLGSLGLHTGIVMSAHPMTLYVYASGDAYQDIMNVKKLVDFQDVNVQEGTDGTTDGTTDDNTANDNTQDNTTNDTQNNNQNNNQDNTTNDTVITDGETSLVKIDLQYITKENASDIISTFGYDVEVLGLDLYEKRIWIKGAADEVEEAVARIKENDTADNDATRTFFTYELQNIVASELQSKIAFLNMDGVEFYFGSYPELTKSIMVYCNKNKEAEIKEIIAALDNANLDTMYYPITTITETSELEVLNTKIALVAKLIDNPDVANHFEISDDLDPSPEGIKHVLYVNERPDNIDLILNMWNKIG